MKLYCIICQELFTSTSEVDATKCGHVFHTSCITEWIGRKRILPSKKCGDIRGSHFRSQSCPHCRMELQAADRFKLYLNIEIPINVIPPEPRPPPPEAIAEIIDSAQAEMNLREQDIQNAERQIETLTRDNQQFSDTIQGLEEQLTCRGREVDSQYQTITDLRKELETEQLQLDLLKIQLYTAEEFLNETLINLDNLRLESEA